MINLRPYQNQSIESLRSGFRAGHTRQILAASTGSGKSIIMMSMIKAAIDKGSRALFICERRVLVDQFSAHLDSIGIDHGVFMASHWRFRPHAKAQVASIQTLERMDEWPQTDIIFIDEIHACMRKSLINYIERNPHAKICGASATPFHPEISKHFSSVTSVITMEQLIKDGNLVPFKVFVAKEVDVEGLKVVAGEWQKDELESRGLRIIGDIVTDYIKLSNEVFGEYRKTTCFSCGVAHGTELMHSFNQAGINAVQISYKDSDDFKQDVINEFKKPDTDIKMVISSTMLERGFDCLDIDTEILTKDGWRGIRQVNKGDLVFALNKETGFMEMVPVESYAERYVKAGEKMLSVKNQRFDIRTTEGHQFHIKYKTPGSSGAPSKNYITLNGRDLSNRRSTFILPLSAEYHYEGINLSDDEIRLIAWFMTDGGFSGRTTFQICQSKEYKHEIRSLLVRIGIDFKEYERNCSGYANGKKATKFDIPKGTHKGSLARNGWAKYAQYLDKNVSPLLHQMTRCQFKVFWDELLKGDGAKQGNRSGWLWCCEKSQADAYTQMAVTRGFSASFSIQKTKLGKLMYLVSCRDKQYIYTNPSQTESARFQLVEPDDKEIVWCIKNRLSTIVTRRGGKIAIIGNCPDVEHVILARPLRKSFNSHVQMAGRGGRPYPGKEFCIASGQRVLTDRGLVPIEQILITDKLWDGESFVTHGGVIFKGIKDVINYAGLTATPNHLVKTEEGWRSFWECASQQVRIVQTGFGGIAIRESENYFSLRGMERQKMADESACSLRMHDMFQSILDISQQFAERSYWWLQEMWSTKDCYQNRCSSPYSCTETALHKPKRYSIQRLWWQRYRVSLQKCFGWLSLGDGKFTSTRKSKGLAVGSNRQQWSLRAGKYSLVNSIIQFISHAQAYVARETAQFSDFKSRYLLCRSNIKTLVQRWIDGRADTTEIFETELQTKREVWDILNSGPRNCFTCEGLLVHNCVIQDHSGNWLRFEDDWNELYFNGVQDLGSSVNSKIRKEPTKKEKEAAKCPKCSHLWPVKSDVCSHCGFVRQSRSDVAAVPGQLIELGNSAREAAEHQRSFFHQLIHIETQRGYKTGWAIANFKTKFGFLPKFSTGLQEPTPEVLGWVKSRQIAWSKMSRKVGRRK